MPSFSELLTSAKTYLNSPVPQKVIYGLRQLSPYAPARRFQDAGKTHLVVIYFLSLLVVAPCVYVFANKRYQAFKIRQEIKQIQRAREQEWAQEHN
ncbi:1-(5-phosphoribosyl)-5-[(5-phosphoribosylamino)methylideneamino] imidazole-4-carboxamide isomerase [Acrasis kona]|uniref:1-(5-phosphoribosyl)-5-[(5-phosphoribosylamino)methylideneamino] imidazole-4-carboxamide isomerase n=1 Tax=Acrasis kona TaxID=1008807 RepID=A0AAW2YZE1_9EUKA